MRIAVTGATGFVGAHSVAALREAGHDVRLLVHPAEAPDGDLSRYGISAGADVVRGDVSDPDAVGRLLDGADALLHMAGIVSVDDRREPEMWRVNVAATAAILTRAVAQGCDPVVYVASYAALFPSATGVVGPETPTADGRSAYGRTKAAADRIARGLQDAGAPVVITYPSSVVGPALGCRRGVTAEGWAPLLRHRIAVSVDAGMCFVDVRDVAAVHAAVMQPGRGPRRYVCGGECVAFDDVVDAIEQASGRPIRRLRVSPKALRAAGRISDLVSRAMRMPPSLSYEAAWMLTAKQPTDDSRTLDELGLSWRPVRVALAEAIRQSSPSVIPTT